MATNSSSPYSGHDSDYDGAVNSRDVEVHLAYYEMARAESLEEKRAKQAALAALLAKRMASDEKFKHIALVATKWDNEKAEEMINGDVEALEEVDCHAQSLEAVVESCGALNDYTMRYSRLFANLCTTIPLAEIKSAIKEVCTLKPDIV